MSSPTSGRQLYDRQIEFLTTNDTDALIDTNYHPEAQLISLSLDQPFVIEGRDNLKDYFKHYMQQLGRLEVKSTDKFVETQDTIAFQATVITGAYGEVRVYDSFYLRDGKIYRHVTGLTA